MKEVKKFRFIPILLAVILAVFLLLSSVTTIPAGHTGVVTTFGKVSGTVLGEGLHFKLPFITNVVKIDNRVLKTEVSSSSASKDLQTVNSTIALNYRIGRANSASIYQNIGTDFENVLINPAIQECVKSVTAQFTAEELITERQKVGDLMREALAEKIGPYGFDIEVFNITSFEFSEEFNAAIEAKQTAQQNALKAEQDLARIKVEAHRPHMLKHTEEYSHLINKYMVRHFVKPGITGWAQVTGFRGETKELWQMEGRVQRDIWYIEHWTFILDLYIMYKTVYNVIRGDKEAY